MSLPPCLKGGCRNTPAQDSLFKLDRNASLFNHDRRDKHHATKAKSLWISQRSIPDLQLGTGFHCTRVKTPTLHDWSKLKHVIGCLWKIIFLPLITSIDEDGKVLTCVDGAHASHEDGKGNSGLFATMGLGAILNVSKKLGLVTTSSTETEALASGERLPKCAWFRCFRLE